MIAAVAIPSMLGFIRHGHQINRMNTARTLYVAMQSQLSRAIAEGNLRAVLTEGFYESEGSDIISHQNNVFASLGSASPPFPQADVSPIDNRENVFFISKRAGYELGEDALIDRFYVLLDEIIINKEILNDAILMEFNVRTGVVLSVFYGDDKGGQAVFGYGDGFGPSGRGNVVGGRGMDGDNAYQYAYQRRQGYFGAISTGVPMMPRAPELVNIYDGVSDDRKLTISFDDLRENILYAEFLLPLDMQEAEYSFSIIDLAAATEAIGSLHIQDIDVTALPVGFRYGFLFPTDGHIIYRDTEPFVVEENGVNIAGAYMRCIWVLDFIEGDIYLNPESPELGVNQPYSIGVMYAGDIVAPTDIRARLSSSSGVIVNSPTIANTHFFHALSSNDYTMKSVRHLNNIRLVDTTDMRFFQIDDINVGAEITNFAPITRVGAAPFNGVYSAVREDNPNSQYKIIDLTINAPPGGGEGIVNIGLFAENEGHLHGVSIFNGSITVGGGIGGADGASGGVNVGAIAGRMGSGTISQSNSYSIVESGAEDTESAGGLRSTGGLVGLIEADGTLTNSFNAGFFNANTSPETRFGVGAVIASSGDVGGLVGRNEGSILNCFNNARVNVESVEIHERLSHTPTYKELTGQAFQGGIAGRNMPLGVIQNTYATNYVSRETAFNSTSGGIVGYGVAGTDSFFISNGSPGVTAISKDDLQGRLIGTVNAPTAFTNGVQYNPLSNSYIQYPYPVLRNNQPFTDPSYDWLSYEWGWEDIFEIELSETVFMYYERYFDGSFGFSPNEGSTGSPLAATNSPDLRNRFVTNDGYVLEFNEMPSLAIIIGQEGDESALHAVFVLQKSGSAGDVGEIWQWSSPTHNELLPLLHVPFPYESISVGENRFITRYRLFFENTFLERFVTGENVPGEPSPWLSFAVKAFLESEEYLAPPVRFSPLFADSFEQDEGEAFDVRSPRHVENVGHEPSSDFIQQLNIDFRNYRKELVVPLRAAVSSMNDISLNNASDLVFLNSPVVGGVFSGEYDGNNLFMRNIAAQGGLFEEIGSGATVRRLSLHSSEFYGAAGAAPNVGSIAAINRGTIDLCLITDAPPSGTLYTGGIVPSGGVTVSSTTAADSTAPQSVGGVVGRNYGVIRRTCVQNAVVSSSLSAETTGGFAGSNESTGVIENVYFLSNADANSPPVSSGGGGIAGSNSGEVSHALYLAPAPRATAGGVTTIYPIVRSGSSAMVTTEPGIGGSAERTFQTCFYLAGHRYSINEGRGGTWTDDRYNLLSVSAPIVELSGGGRGLITDFIDLQWLNHAHRAGLSAAVWQQPTIGYPYPSLRSLPVPARWTSVDSPVRPDQVDRDTWDNFYDTMDSARAPNFINGDFSMGSFTIGAGGNVNDIPSGNRRIYVDMDTVPGWSTRPVSAADFAPTFGGNQANPAPSWRLIELMDPRNHGTGEMLHDYAYSNHQGRWNNPNQVLTSAVRYAELNAEIQGTLYQVLPTTPGQEFYYSFYHTARTGTTLTTRSDRMDFYLTGISAAMPIVVVNPEQLAERDAVLTMIRPCQSPRTNRTTIVPTGSLINSTAWNTAAWNSVAYGANDQGMPFIPGAIGGPFNLSYHRGRSYLQPNGSTSVQNIPAGTSAATRYYLYDVWVGPGVSGGLRPAGGYGITFWSTSNLTTTTAAGSGTNIPLSGITQAQYDGAAWAWLTAARNNVIGYWGVEFGWKHYYGTYEVPEGQILTEFAFRSSRVDAQNGNFLSGISFNAPAFLSIDKFIRTASGLNDPIATFVKPGDSLVADLRIKNWGEIDADRIVIRDQISPFNQYINIGTSPTANAIGTISSLVTVTRGNGTQVTGVTATNSGGIVTITLPAGERLRADEELRITFPITVRNRVLSNDITETLLYFFRNQAQVEYRENFGRYDIVVNRNGSGPEPVEVFINPVSLSKTVESVNRPLPPAEDSLVNGPFRVVLSVENTMVGAIDTDGLISDVIPPGFRLTSDVTRSINNGVFSPIPITPEHESDGSTRLTISNVSLSDTVRRVDYAYTMEYIGSGYGVSRIHLDSAYRFMYQDSATAEPISVLLRFPHSVVGISAKTGDDHYIVDELSLFVLDITANDSFTPIRPEINLANRLADDNYDVNPTVVFTDESGNPLGVNTIDNDYFTAVLIPGSYNIEFTPKSDADGVFNLYYRTLLTASRPGGMVFVLDSRVTTVTVVIDMAEEEPDDDDGFGRRIVDEPDDEMVDEPNDDEIDSMPDDEDTDGTAHDAGADTEDEDVEINMVFFSQQIVLRLLQLFRGGLSINEGYSKADNISDNSNLSDFFSRGLR